MNGPTKGTFTEINGEKFYKIENYDAMDDFFMTITSSSDIWNFIWSKGGITAGRVNCDHSIFPYYTADKVSDGKTTTGSYSLIKIAKDGNSVIAEPFASLRAQSLSRSLESKNIAHNLYKNISGTKVIFEEINSDLGYAFRTGWTSSAKFGLVRFAEIENISGSEVSFEILDGCRNILPASVTASFQEERSFLLDAYKKTDLDTESNLALFTLSSIPSDKAEPNEGLYANTCWFSTDDRLILDPACADYFVQGRSIPETKVLRGGRPVCFIERKVSLSSGSKDTWFQVFDTSLTPVKIVELKARISDRAAAAKDLSADIADGIALMDKYVSESDGIQETSDQMASAHHYANVMFNIMRGGIFLNSANISTDDFLAFVKSRNTKEYYKLSDLICKLDPENSGKIARKDLEKAVYDSGNDQAVRLFLEYMPLTFSRRHGDPSRPWNRFNIRLRDDQDKPILNYEGNWRDIFQNWEALSFSYPEYIKNMVAKFLNAMTAEGYNPYRITRDGLDWEIPDPNNPWGQIGYWGDHQVIYLEKLLELWNKTNSSDLQASLGKAYYSTARVPFILKSYSEIRNNPRHSITFDRPLSDQLMKAAKEFGSDAKLFRNKKGDVVLHSLTSKLIQIVNNKAANFIPGGGIWMNTQRPEWNDANNALAGYGLSMITVCYLRRYLKFLEEIFTTASENTFTLAKETAECFIALSDLFLSSDCEDFAKDDVKRNLFVEKAGTIFQKEYETVYRKGYSGKTVSLSGAQIVARIKGILNHADYAIRTNRREDGLYHAYNTLVIGKNTMSVENLQEMLEGQVAVLSSGLLSDKETLDLTKALKNSAMFEPHQYSYMLYPDKELPFFGDKNTVKASDAEKLSDFIARSGTSVLLKDRNGNFHFNSDFVNANTMKELLKALPEEKRPSEKETEEILNLYEKTFHHQSFTGRSGTFYAFEGLGSIYWHMVAKLLLAVQEYALSSADKAFSSASPEALKTAQELAAAYYDIRKGIGYNKTPEVYGAFPSDPYSHTPNLQGAKQPGMTGQVKEEVLTRWGELGVKVENGTASFCPRILQKAEFSADGRLTFTWCGTKITYVLGNENEIAVTENGAVSKASGCAMTSEQTAKLFARNGSIDEITVTMNLAGNLM